MTLGTPIPRRHLWYQAGLLSSMVNLPAVQQWAFTREDASRITQPALAVIGEKSKDVSPIWIERQNMLVTWLPMATPFVLADATHLLHVENPRGMAEALAGFLQRHPLPRPR